MDPRKPPDQRGRTGEGGSSAALRSGRSFHPTALVRATAVVVVLGLHPRVYYRPGPDGNEPVPVADAGGEPPTTAQRSSTATDSAHARTAVTVAELLQRERLRLSQRVVLHLAAQGRLYDDEIATPAFTQAGMSEALMVGQSPLSNILRRLVLGGVLAEDVRHVRGRPKRLRVYRLTTMGEALAAELRRRGTTPVGGTAPPTDPSSHA